MSTVYGERVSGVVLQDSADVLQQVQQYIPLAIALNDYSALQYHVRLLDTLIDTRCDSAMSVQTRIGLIQNLISVVTSCSAAVDIHILNRCMAVTCKLLKHTELRGQLLIDWRPLYNVLCRYHFIGNDEFVPSDSSVRGHLNHSIKLIQRCRKYFGNSGDCVTSVLNEFLGYITPFDTMQYRAEALIHLFLPATAPSQQWTQIVHQLHTTSQFTDRTPVTHMLYLSVFARIAKHQLGAVQLSAVLPTMFSMYTQSLELEINGKSSSNDSRHWTSYYHLVPQHTNPMDWASKYMAKLIVYTIHTTDATTGTGVSCMDMVVQLLHSIHSYIHPSNTGKWTNYLAVLIGELGRYYAIRRGAEYRREVAYADTLHLPQQDTVFVRTLQSVCETAMYSKSGALVSSALRCLRHLSYWHSAAIFPSILAQAEFALTDVTSAHRALSILQAMTVLVQPLVNRTIYPPGAAHLHRLLYLTLPGIDATDVFKTSYTLSWLTVLFYTIPMVEAATDSSSDQPVQVLPFVRAPADLAELNDDVRGHTLEYPDWCEQLLDATISLVKTQEKYARNDYIAATLATLIYKVLRAFLSALSSNTYQQVVRLLLRQCTENVNLPAVKYWRSMCCAAAIVQPTHCLNAVFNTFARTLQSADGQLTGVSDTVLAWNLHMVAGAVKQAGGANGTSHANALLPHIETISKLYNATCNHVEKDVRKAANKLLKNTLYALTQTYPAEYRSLPPEQWQQIDPQSSAVSQPQLAYWLQLGTYVPPSVQNNELADVGVQWHVPSAQEQQAAQQLITDVMQQTIHQLNAFHQGVRLSNVSVAGNASASVELSQAELVDRHLHQLLAAVRGVQVALGQMTGTPYKTTNNTAQAELSGDQCPRAAVPHTPLTTYLPPHSFTINQHNDNPSLRTVLLQYVLQLNRTAQQNSATITSVKTHTLLLKLLHVLLNLCGVSEHRVQSDVQQSKASRKYLRDYLHQHKSVALRPQHVQVAYETHQQRVATYAYNQTYTVDVHNAVNALMQYTVSSYEKLRHKSVPVLLDCMRRWPLCIDTVLNGTCAVISAQDSSRDAVIGALQLLKEHNIVQWITRKWHRLTVWTQAICVNSMHHADDKIQLMVQQVFAAVYPHISPIAIHIPDIQTSSTTNLTNEQVQKRTSAVLRVNDRVVSEYSRLIAYLIEHSDLSSANTHWRHALMCLAVLYAIMQTQHLHTTELQAQYNAIATLYTNALTSELMPIRRVGLSALGKILALHADTLLPVQHSDKAVPADTITAQQHVIPLSADDMYSVKLNDYAWSGWLPAPLTRSVTSQYVYAAERPGMQISGQLPYYTSVWSHGRGYRLDDSTVNTASRLLQDALPSIVDFLVANHRSLQHDGSKQGATGAGDAISDLVQRHCANLSLWPFTRVVNESKSFDPAHLSLIRAAIQMLPTMIDQNGAFESQLSRLLVAGHEQDKQCTAAELIAGVIMAVRHWPAAQQESVYVRCCAWIDSALQHTQADSVPHYVDALRYACTNTDPRRTAVLNRHIIQLALGTTPTSTVSNSTNISTIAPSIQFKRFKLLLSLCIEYSCRSADLSVYILSVVQQRDLLHHPYKQVREQIGWLLHAAYMNLQQLHATQSTDNTDAYAVSTHPAVQAFLQYTVHLLEQPSSVGGDASKAVVESVLYWLMRSVVSSSVYWLVPLYVLLPHVLNAQRHADIEVQTLAKAAANLLAFAPMPSVQLHQSNNEQHVVHPSMDVLNALLDSVCAAGSTWKYRVTALKWLQIFVPRHSVALVHQPRCMDRLQSVLCDTLMLDSSIEVREEASVALSNYLVSIHTQGDTLDTKQHQHQDSQEEPSEAGSAHRPTTLSVVEIALCKRFSALLRRSVGNGSTVIGRHAAILGLSAIVLIYPYTLPVQIPEILQRCSGAVQDVQPVSGAAKRLFSEFMRTHSDEWAYFKTQFSSEQYDSVMQVSAAPSYIT